MPAKKTRLSDGIKPTVTRKRKNGERGNGIGRNRQVELAAIYHTAGQGSARETARLTGTTHTSVLKAIRNPDVMKLAEPRIDELASKLVKMGDALIDHYAGQIQDANLDNKGVSLLQTVLNSIPVYKGIPTVSVNLNVTPEDAAWARERLDFYRQNGLSDAEIAEVVPEVMELLPLTSEATQ